MNKVFVLSDINTNQVAGDKVRSLLNLSNIPYSEYVFKEKHTVPDEKSVGSAVMHFDKSCDCLITIGSGVLNDISKILSVTAKIPYIIIGTAPSMDGYASSGSALILKGMKVTLTANPPLAIIADTSILKDAPLVGADIVELSPHYDASGVSTAVACKVIREVGLLLAHH